MFSRNEIEHYAFEDVIVGRDIFIMKKMWVPAYEQYIEDVYALKNPEPVGYISHASVCSASKDYLEISWYPNIYDRFHEVVVRLPRREFVACVGCRDIDEKPRIFVSDEWLEDLHNRPYSMFALVDAIGVKKALDTDHLNEAKLLRLREALDELVGQEPGIAAFSFADSVLIKADWTVGAFDTSVAYTYTPERLLNVVESTFAAFKAHLELDCYACITQGFNEYSDGKVIHTSASGNHISLNSLGLPFAQLMSMDYAVHAAIKSGAHQPYQLYLDENYYRSLQWAYGFDRDGQTSGAYSSPMSHRRGRYFCADMTPLRSNLKPGAT